MPFDPVEYLKEKEKEATFDPAAYLEEKKNEVAFDPKEYLASKASPPSKTEALLRGAAEGATMGWANEIAGAAETGWDIATTDKEWKDRGELYSQHLKESEAASEAASKEHPKTFLAGEVGGSLASLAVPGGAVAKGAGLGLKVARGATAGAAFGTVLGAGKAEEGKGVEGALKGAALGAGLGAGFPLVGAGVVAGASKGKALGKIIDNKLMNGKFSEAYEYVAESLSNKLNDAKFRMNKLSEKTGINLTGLYGRMRKAVDNDITHQSKTNKEIEAMLKEGKRFGFSAKQMIDFAKDIKINGDLVPNASKELYANDALYVSAKKIRDKMTSLGAKNMDMKILLAREKKMIDKYGISYFPIQKDLKAVIRGKKPNFDKQGNIIVPKSKLGSVDAASSKKARDVLKQEEWIKDNELLLKRYAREQTKETEYKNIISEAQHKINKLRADGQDDAADEVLDIVANAVGVKKKNARMTFATVDARNKVEISLTKMAKESAQEAEMKQFIKSVAGLPYITYMAANPSSVAKNFVQPLLVAMPEMGSKHFLKAYAQLIPSAAKKIATLDKGKGSRLWEELDDVVLKSNFAGEGMAEIVTSGQTIPGKIFKGYTTIGSALMRPFGAVDTLNRKVVYLAGKSKVMEALKSTRNFDVLKKKLNFKAFSKAEQENLEQQLRKNPEKFAGQYGEFLSSKFNYDYSRVGNSKLQRSGSLGKAVTQFTKWPVNLANMYMQDLKNGNYEQAMKRVAVQVLALNALSEVTGLDLSAKFSPFNSFGVGTPPVLKSATKLAGAIPKVGSGDFEGAAKDVVTASEPYTGVRYTSEGLEHTPTSRLKKIFETGNVLNIKEK